MNDEGELTPEDAESLRSAKQLLEHPGYAARLSALVGTPIENAVAKLPEAWASAIDELAGSALERALALAMLTVDPSAEKQASNRLHKLMVAASGAAGGAFGLASLAVELPISTTLMLRSIADVARSEGERLEDPQAKLACVSVFALGSDKSASDDGTNTGYFIARSSLSRSISEAAQHIARQGVTSKGAPALVRFVGKVGARYGVQVTQKAAAQLVPVLGAAGGAAINVTFMDHFQNIARGHFTIRRLERRYGAETVRNRYELG
jgi:hypothetical protein